MRPPAVMRQEADPSPGRRSDPQYAWTYSAIEPPEATRARRVLEGAGADLVEARAAVHRPIVAWRERDDRLAAARTADRGVELAWALVGSGALRGRSAGRAALRVVDQALAGIEGLLAGREDELLGAIATGQRTVFVHPLQTLLGSDADDPSRLGSPRTGPDGSRRAWAVGGALGSVRARPGTHSGEDTRAVKAFGQRSPQ